MDSIRSPMRSDCRITQPAVKKHCSVEAAPLCFLPGPLHVLPPVDYSIDREEGGGSGGLGVWGSVLLHDDQTLGSVVPMLLLLSTSYQLLLLLLRVLHVDTFTAFLHQQPTEYCYFCLFSIVTFYLLTELLVIILRIVVYF